MEGFVFKSTRPSVKSLYFVLVLNR